MHVTLPQKELELAAQVVSSLVDRTAGPLPVLGNLLMEASGQGLTFRGTDMEALVTVNVGATIKRPGRTTVPADTFRDIVKLLPPQGEVSIEEIGRKVEVQCEANDYKLMTLPADDFPEWPANPGETRLQIAQKTLKAMIEATVYALPVKDHRRVLLGVNCELFDHTLRFTATDGKKLARISTPVPEIEGPGTGAIVIPRKILDNLMRFLGTEGPVEIEFAGRQATFRFSNITYRCNGIDGKYPDCDMVIPKEFPITIDLNRDVFTQAARRAGIVTDDKNKSIILKFENNACQFAAAAHEVGTFSGRISLDYAAAPVELAFNYQFLTETLSRFSSPDIKMLIKNATAPVVFKTKDEEARLALLMPIKLSDLKPPTPVGGDDEEPVDDEEE